jgi:glycosyltransferase involved in cell wall biosynthesis
VLLTAWGFPPARTSGVYRAVALANGFARAGWHVTVLTAPRELFAANGITDYSFEAAVDPRIDVVRVPFSAAPYDVDLRRWSAVRALAPEFWQAWRNRSDQRQFPEAHFGGWSAPLRRAAERVHAQRPVDVAVGTANPYVDFVPGRHLHAHGVPYVMDYRDAWTVDVFRGVDAPAATAAQRAWEAEAIRDAHEVWFVNEPIRGWHADRHPGSADRMRVVPNGYDDPADGTLGVPWRAAQADKLVFGYVGTINTGQFPADALFSGWRRARELDPRLARARLELHGYLGRSGVADEVLGAALRAAEADGVSYEGPVPKADVARVYRRFDVLTLALASGPGVTSGKVYEFAGTGLPVVSIHDRDSAASAVLDGSPVWAPSEDLSPDGVAAALIRGADLALAQTAADRDQAVAWGGQWERSRLLDPHISALGATLDSKVTR